MNGNLLAVVTFSAVAIGLLPIQTAQATKPKAAMYDFEQRPRCKFHYDEKLETRALSILQHELSSDGARYYDAERPITTICRSKATLMFIGMRTVNGYSLLDPPNIFVDVDVCSRQILAVDRDNGVPVITNDPPCE